MDDVLPHLKKALASPHESVRYWCAQIAAEFPSREIVAELIEIAQSPRIDLRFAAVAALADIDGDDVTQFLQKCVQKERDSELSEILEDILTDRN